MPEVTLPKEHETIVKKWHDGKTTYAGAVGAFLVAIGGIAGFSFNETLPIEIARFGDAVEYILIGVFSLMAAYGRAKAISPGFIGKKRLSK